MFTRTRKTRSLKATLAIAALNAVTLSSLAGTALAVENFAPDFISFSTMDDHGSRPVAKGSPEWLMAKHADECWRAGQTAKAAAPGHVIARTHDEGTVTYRSDLVGAALEQALDGKDHGLTVLAFCV